MGEIAEQMIDDWLDRDEPFYSIGLNYNRQKQHRCTRCGCLAVDWVEVHTEKGLSWRLFENGKPHVCKMQDDEFEDLT